MSRKTVIVFFLLSGIASCGYSQRIIPEFPINYITDVKDYKTIDTAMYEINYSLSSKMNVKTSLEEVSEDVCVLQIGNRLSKTYSKTIYNSDSVHYEYKQKYPKNTAFLPHVVPPVEIFKRFPAGKYTTIRLTWSTAFPPVLKYSEDTPVFDWTITTDKKEVEGYPCILATTNFRGRDYEAWFTQDIPLPEGPWMFGGLPGLIMEIRDTQDHYVFKCIGVKQVKDETVPIKYFNRSYEEGSREKIRSTTKKMYDRPQQWAQSQGYGIIIGKKAYDDLMMIYNPIELE